MRKNQFRRLFALLLALTFIFTVPAPIFGSGGGESSGSSITAGITQDQLEILEELRQQREAVAGLHAFEGVNALADDDSPAKVIVMFDTMPAEVQVVEAMAEGLALSFDAAEATAQSAHDVFRQELGSLFPQGRARTAAPYEIWEEYHHAFLGVSLIVPSDMVPALAELDSVLAVFPDEYVFLDPIELDVEAINEAVEMSLALSATRNASPFGMAHGRSMMRADAMHALGYRGQGVLVAVADTGIDYFHPSFDGAFPTLADMHARGATHITQSDLYYIHAGGNPAHSNFAATTGTTPWIPNTWIYSGFQLENTGYHFLGRNTMAGFNRMAAYNYLGQPGADYPLNLPLESFTRLGSASNTTHGTHVAGTIVGRDGGHANSALGVAPEALMIAYRVLATGGGSVTTILRGYEWAFRDGADVVNSSLGGQHNALNAVHAIGINNMMLANPYIIFVNSAGNAGADGFSSVSDPAAATRGITVSALQPQWPNGAAFVSGAIDASVDFLHANSRSNWFWHPERGVINSFVNLPTEGAYRVFVMPRTEGTNQVAVGLPGIGLQSDFVELMIRYGLDDLRGAFVLVSRGGTFNDVSVLASQFGLGGVIAINGVGQAPPAFVTPTSGANVNFVPYMTISNANGLAIRDAVVAATTDYLEFSFQNLRYPVSTLTLASFSSRGPMNMSYEIKPDIGANGQNTWSARPRNVAAGYANSSGTSMSAPHIAGAVALLVNYSRANHEDLPTASENGWTSEEIKIRLMNTAIRMPVTGTTQAAVRGSVYDTGAGQADVFAAAMADSFAYAIFDRVVQSPHSFLVPIDEATDLGTHRVGSFSFGGVNRLLFPATGFSRTMDAAIVNTSTEARTYTITTEWINYLHNTNQDAAANGVTLTLSATTIPVPAGGRVPFTATMVVPATAANGHYEGFITITDNHGTVVASMPFAAAVVETHPVMRDVRLYRNVISTGEYAQNDASSELGMIFRTASRLRGIGTRTWVFERADGLDHLNWMQPEFADYLVGWADQTEILSNPSTVPGMAGGARLTANQLHRAIVFEGYVYSDWEWVVFDETPELYPQNVGINQRHIVPT
ncbi:MAG: S8 family serine peptidase, partial [Defluviitaleaceae bacterium]|nr:S8 family serine peptidase [Defluviitaleaceae bacterium]